MQLLAKSADAEKKRQKAALQDRLHKKRERRMRDLQHKHELELQTKTDAHSVEASEIQDRLDDHDDLVSGRVGTVVYGVCTVCVLWCTVVYCGVLWCTACGATWSIDHNRSQYTNTACNCGSCSYTSHFCSSFGVTVDLHDQHMTNT